MSRVIKFRAWLPDDECFMYSENDDNRVNEEYASFQFSGGKISVFQYQLIDSCPGGMYHKQEDAFMQTPNAIIEQFTGLHDKNGKEIYEGDRLYWKHVSVLSLPHVVTERTLDVVWDEKESRWSQYEHGDCKGAYSVWREWKECEVIGNIHEQESK